MASVLHLVLLYSTCECVTYSRQENTMDKGARSRVLCNQYKWGTLNNPASALYSATYASRATRPLLQGASCWKSPSALFRSSWVNYDYNRPSYRKKRLDDCNRICPNWIEEVMTWFPATGPWRRGRQPWKDLGERSDAFRVEEGNCPTFSEQTLSCEPTERYISNGLHI